jgi:adenine-specific DNA methylase
MESYKERTAKQSQTLTGLGKWWGRKPLVLVRAALLGLLLPSTGDPQADMDVFLRLMTMDEGGLRRRKNKAIPAARLVAELRTMAPSVRARFGEIRDTRYEIRKLSRDEREELQGLVFDRLPYGEKLNYCARPEQIDGPSEESWAVINAHLGTDARNLPELVEALGVRRFGHRPRVGDAFCGGGSVPFEAARLGCDAYGSDLNPVAALLTWAALNIVGGGEEVAEQVQEAQEQVFDAVDRQITEWGIEHNGLGWRADAYLYCVEVTDPESGWRVPLAPNWVIGRGTRTVAKLVPNEADRWYDIEIIEGASEEEMALAELSGTLKNYRIVPPNGGSSTPFEVIRRNMRQWVRDDFMPRGDDGIQERLYCIRWVETYTDDKGRVQTRRHYKKPTFEDIKREGIVAALLRERIENWQRLGYIPSRKIEPGKDINRPTNSRGWSHWHHLFNPRQILINGLFAAFAAEKTFSKEGQAAVLLGIGRLADWNSKQSRWNSNAANEKGEQTFYKPSLATPLANYSVRGFSALGTAFFLDYKPVGQDYNGSVTLRDVRRVDSIRDIWVTDPPYADAVNYHELSEFFLAWYEQSIGKLFPTWYVDSKRSMAISGTNESFRPSMLEGYRNLARQMPNNGLQIVMFTHNEPAIWAELSVILWAAGLSVTAAWTIATEIDSSLKQGNYVQGTVIMVLRKRDENAAPFFLDEVLPRVESEVRRQLDTMTHLDDASDPNFGDADYQLAAYAAALRVLTAQPIEEINPAREITRERKVGEVGPVEGLIRQAVAIACDHLVPRGVDATLWKRLSPMERFYLKGLEVESHGEYRNGVYQELARGFGAAAYTELMAGTQANETRLKSATEFGRRGLGGGGFAATTLRQLLYAIHLTGGEGGAQAGLNYLKTELTDYWPQRERLVALLDYLAALGRVSTMPHWTRDGRAAGLLAGAVRNDHV